MCYDSTYESNELTVELKCISENIQKKIGFRRISLGRKKRLTKRRKRIFIHSITKTNIRSLSYIISPTDCNATDDTRIKDKRKILLTLPQNDATWLTPSFTFCQNKMRPLVPSSSLRNPNPQFMTRCWQVGIRGTRYKGKVNKIIE